jgi:hypothetical protein
VKIHSIALVSSLLIASAAEASTFAASSIGGYQGMMSAGGGYSDDHCSGAATIGHTRSDINVWSLNLRGEAKTSSYRLNPFISLSAIVSLDRNKTFLFLPSQYPRGYYPSTGVYWAPSAGAEYRDGQFGYRAEIVTLDYYVELYYRGKGYVGVSDITTPMFSLRYYFE